MARKFECTFVSFAYDSLPKLQELLRTGAGPFTDSNWLDRFGLKETVAKRSFSSTLTSTKDKGELSIHGVSCMCRGHCASIPVPAWAFPPINPQNRKP
jgi:hypothetical protein